MKSVTVIGAGISGISLAIKLEKHGIPYLIYEKSQNIGGVWNEANGKVNRFSKVQSFASSYKMEDDFSHYTEFTPGPQMMEKIRDSVKKFKIDEKIRYQHELIDFEYLSETKKVSFRVKNLKSNEIETVKSDALYIRTGTLNIRNELHFKGEDKFPGVIQYGSGDNKDEIDFQDKEVVIVGMGATAIENAANALEKGAKKVRFIVRKLRPIWGKKTIYRMLCGAINPLNYLLNSSRIKTWKDINQSYETIVNYLGNETLNKITDASTIKINGNFNHKVSGVPTLNNNFFIFLHYDLIEVIQDEIDSCEESEALVITKKGDRYPADILLKCTGSRMDDSVLKGHLLTDYVFVDRVPFITHNCGIDRLVSKFHILGPDSSINMIPLVSYPLINQVLDELAIYYLTREDKFNNFLNYRTFFTGPVMVSVDDLDFRSYFYLYWKILKYVISHPWEWQLVKRLGTVFINMIRDVRRNLSEERFHEIDKDSWNTLSRWCHGKRPDRPYLEYPF